MNRIKTEWRMSERSQEKKSKKMRKKVKRRVITKVETHVLTGRSRNFNFFFCLIFFSS